MSRRLLVDRLRSVRDKFGFALNVTFVDESPVVVGGASFHP